MRHRRSAGRARIRRERHRNSTLAAAAAALVIALTCTAAGTTLLGSPDPDAVVLGEWLNIVALVAAIFALVLAALAFTLPTVGDDD